LQEENDDFPPRQCGIYIEQRATSLHAILWDGYTKAKRRRVDSLYE
jgi:hypothetical protein